MYWNDLEFVDVSYKCKMFSISSYLVEIISLLIFDEIVFDKRYIFNSRTIVKLLFREIKVQRIGGNLQQNIIKIYFTRNHLNFQKCVIL